MDKGQRAFDELVRDQFMEVNEMGWGRITKRPRNQRDLDFLVSRIKTLGAYSVYLYNPPTIEVSTGGDADSLVFRKRSDQSRPHPNPETEALRDVLKRIADFWDDGDNPLQPSALLGDTDRTIVQEIHRLVY